MDEDDDIAEEGSGGGTPFDAAKAWYMALVTAELARQGKPEAALLIEDRVRLDPVETMTGAGGGTRVAASLSVPLTDYSVEMNAVTGEVLGWHIDLLAEGSTATLPGETLVERAGAVAELPADAVLEVAEYETEGPAPVFRARWEHRIDGVQVESDAIEVLLNGANGRAFSYNRVWHAPTPGLPGTER